MSRARRPHRRGVRPRRPAERPRLPHHRAEGRAGRPHHRRRPATAPRSPRSSTPSASRRWPTPRPVLEGLASELSPEQLTRIGLVLNVRGIERAIETSLQEVNVVVVSTDTFANRNQGQTPTGLIDVLAPGRPDRQGRRHQARPSPSPRRSAARSRARCRSRARSKLAEQVAATGVEEIALADTIGVGVPVDVRARFDAVRAVTGDLPLRAHFHNTRNTGYANALAAYESGVTILDASLGGIGGCPFAPKATGNIATEDLVYLFERSGITHRRRPRRADRATRSGSRASSATRSPASSPRPAPSPASSSPDRQPTRPPRSTAPSRRSSAARTIRLSDRDRLESAHRHRTEGPRWPTRR